MLARYLTDKDVGLDAGPNETMDQVVNHDEAPFVEIILVVDVILSDFNGSRL